MSLNQKIITGSIWSFLGNISFQLSGLIIFIVLSRILSPVDFGTAALAIVFVELSNTIVRYGLVEVLIRSEHNDNIATDTFYGTLFAGILVSALFLLSSYYLESLFEAPGLAISIQLLSITPILQALTTVPEGLLKKSFKFKALAFRLLISSSLSGAVAICLALTDFGFYSLIFQKVMSVLISVILVWSAISWRPKLNIDFVRLLKVFKQGQPILLSSLVGQGIFRFVELIIGFFLGVAVLGYFKIAGKLLDVIVQFTIRPIVDVSISAFSNLKNDTDELELCFRNFISTTAVFSIPIFVGGFLIGDDMVQIVFGDKWSESGIIFSILCLSGLSATFNYFFAPLCHATHNSDIPFKLRIVEFIITISAVIVFSQYSIKYVALSNVITAFLLTCSMFYILGHKFSYSINKLIKSLLPMVLSSLAMGVVLFLLIYNLPIAEVKPLYKVIVITLTGLVFYVLFFKLVFPQEAFDIISNIKNLKYNRKKVL